VNTLMKLRIPLKERNFVACIATIRFSGITVIILLGIMKYKDDKVVCVCVRACMYVHRMSKVTMRL
jgi:hypothetical protein